MADIERYEGGIEYVSSGNIFEDAHRIIDEAQHDARQSVSIFLVARELAIWQAHRRGGDCKGRSRGLRQPTQHTAFRLAGR
jgi:hypothetical protein